MRSLIGSSLRFRFLVVAIAAVVVAVGITQLGQAPIDVLPEFSPTYVEVQTESLGLSAEEVEQLITVPLEHDILAGTPWLESMRSESVPGLSSIVLVFKPGTDLMQARQMVSERMTQAVALPHVSKPPTILQPTSATGRVMMVGISSRALSLLQLGVLARWTIAPRLMGVPGVASVAVWGQRDRQLQVLVDPQRMQAQNVPLTTVLETTGNALWVSSLSFVEASTPGTGGFIDTPNQRLGIRHVSPIVTPEGLAAVPISDLRKADGTPLRLSDVANVVEDHQPLIGDAVVDDGSGLLLVIEKFPGSSALEVTRDVEAVLAEMQPGLPGVTIDSGLYRPATFIERALRDIGLALGVGSILLVLVLGVIYWNWRAVLISAIAIPMSLVAAALVVALSGATMNVIVLAGLLVAVGAVVDDAIVDVENVVERLRRLPPTGDARSTARVVLEASSEARGAILFAALIGVAAVLPVFFIGGASGGFFRPLALGYALAVVTSMVVALTVTPALCLILLPSAPSERGVSPVVRWLRRGYEGALARILPRWRWIFGVQAALLLVGLAVLPFVRTSLIPTFKERDLLVHLTAAPGTSQGEMSRVVGLVSSDLQAVPGVTGVGAHIGRAVLGDQVVDVNSAEVWVNVDGAVDHDATVSAVNDVLAGFPGIKHDVQTYLGESSRDVVAAPRRTVVVRVYGDVDEVLRAQAEKIRQSVAGLQGVASTRIDEPTQQLTVQTEVDIDAAQRYGLKPGDVRRAAAAMFSGIQVGSLFEEQKIFDVVVWSTPETRHSLNSIADLMIDTPDGQRVRLGDVAKVRVVPAPAAIRHEAIKRYFDVVANVQGRDLGAVTTDVQARVSQLEFPLEYHASVLDAFATTRAEQIRIVGVGTAALIAIFLLLQVVTGSWRFAAASFVALPTALVGGVLAAYATGGVISLGSLVGFLTVFGIAARNGIMLVKHYQHLEREEGETFGLDLVLRGARERFAPILATALACGLALVPALFLGDVPGLEIMRPMAVVVLGGIVTSTWLSLFAAPAAYLSLASARALDLELEPQPELLLDRANGASQDGEAETPSGPIHPAAGGAAA